MCNGNQLPHTERCFVSRAETADAIATSQFDKSPMLAQKGLTIWVESVDDLVRALPFELDADLEHLHALPEGSPTDGTQRDNPDFPRDLGVRCRAGQGMPENQDNYACVQVDDIANPWGLYAVADGQGPQGHLVSTLLVHELPSLLAQNPSLHRDSNLALYQSFVSVGEMASTCQFIDASTSGGTMSAVLMREGILHVSWVGDSKVVLGRVAAKPGPGAGDGAAGAGRGNGGGGSVMPAGRTRPGDVPAAQGTCGVSRSAGGARPPPLLRAVELTAESSDQAASGWRRTDGTVDSADGAGGPPVAVGSRFFGNSKLRSASGAAAGGSAPCAPEVRRLRLKPEDVFVVLGTSGLWQHLSPSEVVTIVGQNLHRMASDAVDALVTEIERRSMPGTATEDLTAMVVFLAGERYVSDFDIHRAHHLPDHRGAREGRDIPGCGCMPTTAARPQAVLNTHF